MKIASNGMIDVSPSSLKNPMANKSRINGIGGTTKIRGTAKSSIASFLPIRGTLRNWNK